LSIDNRYFHGTSSYANPCSKHFDYKWLTAGGQSVAFFALSPAIHEEIVFRLFILSFCLYLLRYSRHPQSGIAISLVLAVVPHSLNHVPDLFLKQPLSALFLFGGTSIVFGLPMALI
jgi:predicted Abi (CAAX) family protease